MNVSSIIAEGWRLVKHLHIFKSNFETAAASKGWLVFLLHAIDEDADIHRLNCRVSRSSLEYLNIRRANSG
jgi:hypothetical protein